MLDMSQGFHGPWPSENQLWWPGFGDNTTVFATSVHAITNTFMEPAGFGSSSFIVYRFGVSEYIVGQVCRNR